MQSNKAEITALYCRLSRYDGNKETASNSIENQKIMLSRYAQEKGFENTRFYVDDGFIGTSFNRPDFKRMMEDVEAGYISTMNTVQQSRDMFLKAVRKVIEMEALSAPLVRELIDHIDVYEAEGKGKNKMQRVVIHYNFVGYLEIPENDTPCFTADTRQGVAIGYIAKPKEKSA